MQFTAMAILILQAEGKLDVQDRICTYLPDCPESWQAITIHQLLNHTSGIPNFTGFVVEYQRTKATPSSPGQTMARFKDKPLAFQPGDEWSYSNSGYIVLGFIIEQVSGQAYDDFLQARIFEPLAMKNSGYDHNRDDLAIGYANELAQAEFIDMSIPHAAGALYSTVEDLYTWDQALYTEQLVSQALLDSMFSPSALVSAADGWGYGYGWLIGQAGNRQVITHVCPTQGLQFLIRTGR